MEFFLIYLFVMSSKIAAMLMFVGKFLLIPSLVLLGITTLFCLIYSLDYDFEDAWNSTISKHIKRLSKICIPIGLTLVVMSNLIPTEKQLAIIIGSGVTYNILTSEPAQRIGGKALELLQKKIDKALEEEDTDGSQTEEEKESNGQTKAPQSGSQESTQGTST